MTVATNRRFGFTMVEMLVVVGIITVLVAMLLPALGGAQRRASKLEEFNRLRQIGFAWNLYANDSDDAALPGYLEENVQTDWEVLYRFPDKSDVPVTEVETWPWRLLGYLDFDHDVILGYLDKVETSKPAMMDYDLHVDPEDPSSLSRPEEIAQYPAFGYNAYYIGGWWKMVSYGSIEMPRPRFYDAHHDGQRISVVARSISSIRNTDRMVVFCSSAAMRAGEALAYKNFVNDYTLGSHCVVPPTLADVPQWSLDPDNPSFYQLKVLIGSAIEPTSVPIGRYTGQAAALHADGHIEPHLPGDLMDQRAWINTATSKDFTHSEGST